MTSATEELRRLLDERGVEWEGDDTPCAYPRTVWGEVGGFLHEAIEYSGGLDVTSEALNVTPEQAIKATLGRGTCKLTMNGTNGCFGCSECLENIPPLANYCPNCGRKVVGA